MNYRLTEGLSLCSAVAVGMAISTGYPAGIVAAVGMPIACLTPASRKLAFRNTISYYLAGLWPMVSGAGRFTGSVPIAILFWAGTATLLSAPWALAWTPKRGLHCLWRVILAGIAGYLFPGTGWAGLAATALLPGIILALPDSRSRIWRSSCIARDGRTGSRPSQSCSARNRRIWTAPLAAPEGIEAMGIMRSQGRVYVRMIPNLSAYRKLYTLTRKNSASLPAASRPIGRCPDNI